MKRILIPLAAFGLGSTFIASFYIGILTWACTHLGCRITWHPDQGHYISPRHDGHFDIVGKVISGPPPRPLDEFIAEIKNGNLIVFLPPIKRNG